MLPLGDPENLAKCVKVLKNLEPVVYGMYEDYLKSKEKTNLQLEFDKLGYFGE